MFESSFICRLNKALPSQNGGRGVGQVVNVLAFSYDYPSVNPVEVCIFSVKFLLKRTKINKKETGTDHRHLKKQSTHWPGPPVFVDSSSCVTNCHKTCYGTVCGAGVLICLACCSMAFIQQPACQLRPMSSLFLLDVYGDGRQF